MPPLKKNEKLMLAGIGVMIIVFIAMDPYYFIYRKPPVEEPAAPPAGAKPTGLPPPAAQSPAVANAAATVANVAGKVTGQLAAVITGAEQSKPKRERIPFTNWVRDPFAQSMRSLDDQLSVSTLKLGGISVRGGVKYALINSQVMREGDMIGGLTLSKIEKDRVLLSKGSISYTLTWGQH